MSWEVSAPSNIALIKYMGKSAEGKNIGSNPSLSLTLPHLRSYVGLQKNALSHDDWQPMSGEMTLSETGKNKFLKHFLFLKENFGITKDHFTVYSKNDFPADCGIASSASSFAALTKCASLAFAELTGKSVSVEQQAIWSRHGSGSSCRSFYDGYVEWNGADKIHQVSALDNEHWHQVFILDHKIKSVSSSQAHVRVATSSLMSGRAERAAERLQKIKTILCKTMDWQSLFEISWAEFWDMHALFETSQPPFGYFLPKSLELLLAARAEWQNGDGPVVTMDAGPNVHLIWRKNQTLQAQSFAQKITQQLECSFFSNMESL